ncbi:MAG: hypothetical protein JW876_02310 [Candidatus Krumholzibacteriota bacterium]|nr:hypothetical protein [Candidatus Krumholzibacteriota bacterium]
MADPLIFGEREIEFLKELIRQKVQFMIVGLSAAALQGAPVVTQGVDLWFRTLPDPGLESVLKKFDGSYIPPVAGNPPMIAGDGVELFDIVIRMDGLEAFDDELEHAVKIPLGRMKVPVLPLERIIESKKAAGRAKDRIVLKVLVDAARTLREREDE